MVEELSIEQIDVRLSCQIFSVSRSGYYGWFNRPQSARKLDNIRLADKIKAHWENSRKTYGRRRIKASLEKDNEFVGKNRIDKLMRENNLNGAGKKKFKPMTTTSNHKLEVAPRRFKIEESDLVLLAPNKVWGGDITYIDTNEGWLYLSVVIDLFTKKVVGHSMDEKMPTGLVVNSLEMAIKRQILINKEDLIFHSDRGSQYAANSFKNLIDKNQIKQSMSRKGNCYDNAMVETFFKTLKVELGYKKFKTREEGKRAIFEYIEVWYNRQRLHSSIDYMSPELYESKFKLAA